jgi:hypothetical protein
VVEEVDSDGSTDDLAKVGLGFKKMAGRRHAYLSNICADDSCLSDKPQSVVEPSWEVDAVHLRKSQASYSSKFC